MTPIGLLLFFFCSVFILLSSKNKAPLVIIVSCCYITVGQGISIAGANFPAFRFIIALGVLRTLMRGERLSDGLKLPDKVMVLWAIWSMFASFHHEFTAGSGPKFTAGVIVDLVGSYYLFRVFLSNFDETISFIKSTSMLLAPIALFMFVEQAINYNIFSSFGYVPEHPIIRDGRTRAQGPFSHPILAGSIGAAFFPLAIAIWNSNRKTSIIGIISSTTIVIASASSGPILSLGAGISALLFWRYRQFTKKVFYLSIVGYIFLDFVMNKPAYYLISRIDLTGSSTGWHRSFLIDQTIKYFNEWWLFGTDRTVHWMPMQGRISENHTDITNYYIQFGVNGGLMSMALILTAIFLALKYVSIFSISDNSGYKQFIIWGIGCSIFANSATSVSVSFFGQSQVFFWIPIAIVTTLASMKTDNDSIIDAEYATDYQT
ncbi:hypothetical protein MLD52_15050 [Puniceicoccaceae bacterium K14]|nr:hypothetical protein [Puniceicoccaceae bacterium K14]